MLTNMKEAALIVALLSIATAAEARSGDLRHPKPVGGILSNSGMFVQHTLPNCPQQQYCGGPSARHGR